MRKVSEVLKEVLPHYKAISYGHICCFVENNEQVTFDFTDEEQDATIEVIRAAIDNKYTLTGYLETINPEYKGMCQSGSWCEPEPHAIRVKWLENLISELEQSGN